MILKIGGVTPEQLARLHRHLADAASISGPIEHMENIGHGDTGMKRVAFRDAAILNARLEKETQDSYTLELRVLATVFCSGKPRLVQRPPHLGGGQEAAQSFRHFLPSIAVLQQIMDALDLFPAEERDEEMEVRR